MKKILPLFLLLFLITGYNCRAISVSPQYIEERMQESRRYLSQLQQTAQCCAEIRVILRRGGKAPVLIPLNRQQQDGIRKLIMRMQPVVADYRLRKVSKKYSSRLQFMDAQGEILAEFATTEVASEKGWQPSQVSLSKEELKLWLQYVRQDYIEQLIRQQ